MAGKENTSVASLSHQHAQDVRGGDISPVDIWRDEGHGTEAGETMPGILRSVLCVKGRQMQGEAMRQELLRLVWH